MSAVETTIVIDAPPQQVWDVVMDPERLDEWVTILRRLEDHGPDRMEQVLCIRGVSFHVKWELADSDEPRHAKWKGKGPARSRAETEYTLTDEGGRTRFDYRNDFKAPLGPLGAVASRALVGGVPEREALASLERLKKIVESG